MRKMMLLVVLMAAVLLTGFPVVAAAPPMTLIDGITITPPDPSLPAEVKAFFGPNLSGKWKGNWQGYVRHGSTYSGPGFFVLKSVDKNIGTAKVIATKGLAVYEGELAFKSSVDGQKLCGEIKGLQFEFWFEGGKLKARSFSNATGYADFEPML